jgi:hypothetical protein
MEVFKNKIHVDILPITSAYLFQIKQKRKQEGKRFSQGKIIDTAVKVLYKRYVKGERDAPSKQ